MLHLHYFIPLLPWLPGAREPDAAGGAAAGGAPVQFARRGAAHDLNVGARVSTTPRMLTRGRAEAERLGG